MEINIIFKRLMESEGTLRCRDECLHDLGAELHTITDARERQVKRFLMLRLAGVVRQQGDHETAQMLASLAIDPERWRPSDWRVTLGAIEVTQPRDAPLRCHLEQNNDPIDMQILHELESLGQVDVGPSYERKFRFTKLSMKENGTLDVGFAPSSWQEGRRFHAAQAEDRKRFLDGPANWVLPVPLGDLRLPGLAVVHAIVVTADGAVLMAQRSSKVAYAPLYWSASFEEQITEKDVAYGDEVFHYTAQRGMQEEFGVSVPLTQIHLISTLLQMDNLNLGAVVLLEASESLAQLRKRWSSPQRPTHAWEAEEVDGEVADSVTLGQMVRESAWREGAFHPTSSLRLAMLSDWLKGRKAS